jgi:hypothetical protein
MALAALFAVAPLLTGEAAYAGRTESGKQVVFAGSGMLALSCAAEPDVRSLKVPADSTVRVVNDTGHGADLLLDGRSHGQIPKNGSTQVVFRRGTVAVALDPDCMGGDQSESVFVTTAPAAGPTSTSTPAPIPVPGSSSGPVVLPSSSGPATSTTSPSGGSPTSPSQTPPKSQRPSTPPTSGPRTSAAVTSEPRTTSDATMAQSPPRGGSDGEHDETTGDAAGGTSSSPTTPPAEDSEIVPGGSPQAGAPGTDLTTPAVAPAAEPVAALEPLPATGSVGLLALTAMVCVAGVTAGAIRTIVAQRANRINVA